MECPKPFGKPKNRQEMVPPFRERNGPNGPLLNDHHAFFFNDNEKPFKSWAATTKSFCRYYQSLFTKKGPRTRSHSWAFLQIENWKDPSFIRIFFEKAQCPHFLVKSTRAPKKRRNNFQTHFWFFLLLGKLNLGITRFFFFASSPL